MSSTVGSHLKPGQHSVLSPRDVISEARQQVLSNTISEGLGQRGNRGVAQTTLRNG